MNFSTILQQIREAVQRRLPGRCPTLTVVSRRALGELLEDYDRVDGIARGAHAREEALRQRIRELEAKISEQDQAIDEFCDTTRKNALQLRQHGDKRREWRKLERSLMCRILDLTNDGA